MADIRMRFTAIRSMTAMPTFMATTADSLLTAGAIVPPAASPVAAPVVKVLVVKARVVKVRDVRDRPGDTPAVARARLAESAVAVKRVVTPLADMPALAEAVATPVVAAAILEAAATVAEADGKFDS